MQVHRLGVAGGQDERGSLALAGADRPEDVGGSGALIVRRRGPRAASCPAPGDLVLLADAGLVPEPDLYRPAFRCPLRAIASSVRGKFYGMARPSFSVGATLPDNLERGADDGDRGAWDRSWKNSCSVAGLDGTGRVILRRRLTRESVVRLAGTLPACVVAMEACCGAHHLGRVLREQGHEVRLMSPEYVQPYVKAQKNDERDAEAIAEAATRPTMRFVELKSEAQLDAQILHRARSAWSASARR